MARRCMVIVPTVERSRAMRGRTTSGLLRTARLERERIDECRRSPHAEPAKHRESYGVDARTGGAAREGEGADEGARRARGGASTPADGRGDRGLSLHRRGWRHPD